MIELSQLDILTWECSEALKLAQQLECEVRRFIIEFEKATKCLQPAQTNEFAKTLDAKHASLGLLIRQLSLRINGTSDIWPKCRRARNDLAHKMFLRLDQVESAEQFKKIDQRLFETKRLFQYALMEIQEFRKYCRPLTKSQEKLRRKSFRNLLRRPPLQMERDDPLEARPISRICGDYR